MTPAHNALRQAHAMAATDPRAAIATLEDALRQARDAASTSDVALLAKHLAVLCEGRGDVERAAELYGEAVANDPDDPWLHLASAGALVRLERWRDARDAYTRCIVLARLRADHAARDGAESGLAALDHRGEDGDVS